MRSGDSVRAAIVLAALLVCPSAAFAVSEVPISAKTVRPTEVASLEQPSSSTQAEAFSGSPIAIALSNALKGSGASEESTVEVIALYEERGGQSIWLADDNASVLIAALSETETHALPQERYGALALNARHARIDEFTDEERAEFEADLTAVFTAYARDLSSGLLSPVRVSREIEIYPERASAGALLREASVTDDLPGFLRGLAPQHDAYWALRLAFADVKTIDPDAWGPEVPAGRTLKYGMRDKRVAALRDRLTALGFAPSTTADDRAADPLRIDRNLEDAIIRFQADRGLVDDGVVGSRTLAALNQSPRGRLAQIAVNMERLRWHNRDLGWRHVLVNQASFSMTVFENNTPVLESRVVVGKARKFRTPEFSDQMEYLVFNPYWNVPKSIARDEILPLLKNDPSYLSRNNMTATPWEGYSPPPAPAQSAPIEPGQVLAQNDVNAPYRPVSTRSAGAGNGTSDEGGGTDATPYNPWQRYSGGHFPYTIRQNPGAGNALGDVKFLFPNKHSIYLHDTPSKKLFLRERRDFSHGCVRVQKPIEFAELILGWQTEDPDAYMRRMLAYSSEKWITIKEPIPVHLTYRTASLNAEGTLDFLPDVYGRDAIVAAALEAEGVELR